MECMVFIISFHTYKVKNKYMETSQQFPKLDSVFHIWHPFKSFVIQKGLISGKRIYVIFTNPKLIVINYLFDDR
jgi:hypothetical protein